MTHKKHNASSHARNVVDCDRSKRELGTLPPDANECIWMRAHVIAYRLCERNFDCERCPLHAALRGNSARGEASAQPAARDAGPGAYRLYPRDRRFGACHTWVQASPDHPARIGIDALAAWLVGEIGEVQLAPIDSWLDRGDTVATLVSDGVMIKIRTPISGRVLAHNQLVAGCPDLVTAAPYGAGWLADLALAPERQLHERAELIGGSQMETLAQTSLLRFHRRVDSVLTAGRAEVGSTMADGGTPVDDVRAMLGSTRYLELLQEIFA